MPHDVESAARFEKFVIMRLMGQNDMVYRNYDLLSPERRHLNIEVYIRAAGFPVPHSGPNEVLTMLRHRYKAAGYGDRDIDWYRKVLHEFWVYQRIKHYGKKNWPFRDPDVIRGMQDDTTLRGTSDTLGQINDP